MATDDFFRDLERTRLRALLDRDMDAARSLHAEDYELITPGSARLSREAYLGPLESGEFAYDRFEPESDIAVRAWTDVAAVRYVASISARWVDGRDEGRFWHTDIYEQRDGRWQAVWSQATRIRPDA